MSGELAGTLSNDSHGRPSQVVAFRYGNIVTPISVTATAQMIPASEWRNSLLMTNKGANTVYVGFDNTVTDTDGIEIASGGGEKSFSVGAGICVYVV